MFHEMPYGIGWLHTIDGGFAKDLTGGRVTVRPRSFIGKYCTNRPDPIAGSTTNG
jgi:hypothetical protein